MELFARVEADPFMPQVLSRRFGINKTLTWNVARFIRTDDSIAATPHIPGSGSIDKLVRAIELNTSVERDIAQRVRDAARRFDEVIAMHVGDRASLEALVDSMRKRPDSRVELSWRMAYRGNTGIYGVRARTRVQSCFIVPNRNDSSYVDIAMVSGYVGFRRLRPATRWTLFRVTEWSDADDPLVTGQWEPIERSPGPQSPSAIMHSFTRGAAPEIVEAVEPDGRHVILMPGLIGNAGAFDYFRGDLLRAAVPRCRRAPDETGEFGCAITTPVEHMVFDVIAHRDLAFALRPQVLVFAEIFKAGRRPGDESNDEILPMKPIPKELVGTPPVMGTPLIPRYPELVQTVCGRLGVDPRDCRATRLHVRYPPLGATILQRFPLPDAPQA
jgi:hypothetical protein